MLYLFCMYSLNNSIIVECVLILLWPLARRWVTKETTDYTLRYILVHITYQLAKSSRNRSKFVFLIHVFGSEWNPLRYFWHNEMFPVKLRYSSLPHWRELFLTNSYKCVLLSNSNKMHSDATPRPIRYESWCTKDNKR